MATDGDGLQPGPAPPSLPVLARNPLSRRLRRLLATAMLLSILGAGALWWVRSPRTTPAMRGEVIARTHGCFACHGPGGMRSSPNAGEEGAEIPQWDQGMHMMYIRRESDIREWILYGSPRTKKTTGDETAERPVGVVRMPAFEDTISSQNLEDLVAYYKAVAEYGLTIPEEAAEGRRVAKAKGCFACHGPSGRGGPPNPGAFKGYIPPWDGGDFDELVRDEAELRAWILDGGIPRFLENPVARYFLDRQKIKMPAYRKHLTPQELDAILRYVRYLRATRE